ncbi:hypothetical protein Bbelb_359920 [Branchiostoma belcheri]|nr:hypothetical protein Bbelb_359920 [Branchiostoma belcheri]
MSLRDIDGGITLKVRRMQSTDGSKLTISSQEGQRNVWAYKEKLLPGVAPIQIPTRSRIYQQDEDKRGPNPRQVSTICLGVPVFFSRILFRFDTMYPLTMSNKVRLSAKLPTTDIARVRHCQRSLEE